MRVLAISGSHNKRGNTRQLLDYLIVKIGEAGVADLKIKTISLSGLRIKPCKACRKCMETGKCVLSDDFRSIAKLMLKSDLIILGSPVYFHDVSGQIKNLIDRTYSLWHERQLKGKRIIPVAVCAESGNERTLETIKIWAQAHEMKIVNSVSGMGHKREEILVHGQAIASIEEVISDLVGKDKNQENIDNSQ